MLRGVDGAVLPAFFRSFGAGSFGRVGGEASVLRVMNQAGARTEKRAKSFHHSVHSVARQHGPAFGVGVSPRLFAFSLFSAPRSHGRSGPNLGRAKSRRSLRAKPERDEYGELPRKVGLPILNNALAP